MLNGFSEVAETFQAMSSRITIEDVAAKAQVSKVTVSYVLNDRAEHARISAATAERVRKAAEELGYRKNAVARMLKTRRSYILAVLFQYADFFSIGSEFTGEVMRGVCEAATNHGYDLMLHTRASASPEEEVSGLVDGRVDGILVLRDADDPAFQLLLRQGVPCVGFFCATGTNWVDADNETGGRMATSHLASLGHRQLMVLHGAKGSSSSNERTQGALAAARELGLPEPLLFDSADVHGWKEVLRSTERPTGVVAWADDTAVNVIDFLREIEIECPKEVSVVGFDSLSKAVRNNPPITSIAQPVHEMALSAVKMLVDLIEEREVERQLRFPVRLDVRSSTAPVAGVVRELS